MPGGYLLVLQEACQRRFLILLPALLQSLQHRPKVTFLGLGETDEYAHNGRYDLYLEQANKVDRMIAEL